MYNYRRTRRTLSIYSLGSWTFTVLRLFVVDWSAELLSFSHDEKTYIFRFDYIFNIAPCSKGRASPCDTQVLFPTTRSYPPMLVYRRTQVVFLLFIAITVPWHKRWSFSLVANIVICRFGSRSISGKCTYLVKIHSAEVRRSNPS